MKPTQLKSLVAAAALFTASAGLSASAGPFDSLEVSQEALALAQYEAVYIAPVVMDLKFDTQFRNIRRIQRPGRDESRPMTDAEIERKANDLHKDLRQALSKRMTLVDAPGEGVLTVEATVTRILPSRPTQEELGRRVGLQLSGSISAGGADIDVALSENGTSLAQISEDYKGNLNDGFPRVNIWQDADRAYDRLAKKLARYVAKN